MQVGVEIGGTFTDLVAATPDGLRIAKVPSTPTAPDDGALTALTVVTSTGRLVDVATIVHGSTVATNAVLERAGGRGALLVTTGFGDLLELQRQDRTDPYTLRYVKPLPLVRREDVFEVDERVGPDGDVVRPLTDDQVDRVLDEVVERGLTGVTVCFLHSYRYPAHERRVAERAASRHPGLAVTLSHEVCPEVREYERASTAVLSGYVQPTMDRYLGRMERRLADAGFAGDLHVMQSNGGALPADLIRRHAVRTLLSGPAGGITAAREVAGRLGIGELLTFDMGGTSTDVALVRGGRADVRTDTEIDRLPIRVPMLDIVTVGSGGGSVASVDDGGLLHVGPRSAGAVPGPACYGSGGVEATTTDANVVLGLLRPESRLAGTLALDVDAARAACARLGARLGVDEVTAARAVVDVANASIKAALRLASTERGVDPESYWLFTYGGAGGQHAVPVADELGLRGVVVPYAPGLFSAYGLLIADIERDWSLPLLAPLRDVDPDRLAASWDELCTRARAEFATAGVDTGGLRYAGAVQLRYAGQAFELDVELPDPRRPDLGKLADAFHDMHRERYGHASRASAVEVVGLRVTATSARDVETTALRDDAAGAEPPVVRHVPALADEPVTYVHRDAVTSALAGPAVVEERTSSTWVPPGWVAEPHPTGHLLVTRAAR